MVDLDAKVKSKEGSLQLLVFVQLMLTSCYDEEVASTPLIPFALNVNVSKLLCWTLRDGSGLYTCQNVEKAGGELRASLFASYSSRPTLPGMCSRMEESLGNQKL